MPVASHSAALRRLYTVAVTVALLALAGAGTLRAQDDDDDDEKKPEASSTHWYDRISVGGSAAVGYHHFDWQTDTARRDFVDIERLTVEAEVQLSEKISFETEVEIEHAGTGSTMEFDRFEEFGEFETDIEKGGEVRLEKMQLEFGIVPEFSLRAGYLVVPVGQINVKSEPLDYFTVSRSESEAAMLPNTWSEAGLEAFGTVGSLRYRAMMVTGLDASGFSSANWIQRGHQLRFETINAENFAFVGALDWKPIDELNVGATGYIGNTSGNRPKPDLTDPATVTIGEFHAGYKGGGLTLRGQALYGTLSDAEDVSRVNRNLSNNLNVKRTPVGSAAFGWYLEAGYDILPLFSDDKEKSLTLFGRYDSYDTMEKTAEGIFDNPRWERKSITAGANYRPIEDVVVKAQFTNRTLGLQTNNIENTFSLGMGLEF